MKLFLILFLSVLVLNAEAQSFTISAKMMNVAYIGIPNSLTIVADNAGCKELMAVTDNGTIQKKDGCHFYFTPDSEGKAIVTIQKKVNGKNVVISTKELRVKDVPKPHVMIANKTSGYIPLAIFKQQKGIDIGFDNGTETASGYSVISFGIACFYNPCGDLEEDIIGNKFTDFSITIINRLKVKDKVIIGNIKVKGPDSKIVQLESTVFIMR